MAKRYPNFIPIRRIAPGGTFMHYQEPYRRATLEEEPRHPGQELLEKRGPGKIILAYQLKDKGGGKTPVSFNADARVIVPRRRRQ
jgi:hypothetical protein